MYNKLDEVGLSFLKECEAAYIPSSSINWVLIMGQLSLVTNNIGSGIRQISILLFSVTFTNWVIWETFFIALILQFLSQ